MEMRLKEIQRAVEELDKCQGNAYRQVGALFLQIDDKEKVKEDMSESIETYGIRIKAFERQEADLKERFDALQAHINKAVGSQ